MVGSIQAYQPYNPMPPPTMGIQSNVAEIPPQAPEYNTLDTVELGIKSIWVGRMAANAALVNVGFEGASQNAASVLQGKVQGDTNARFLEGNTREVHMNKPGVGAISALKTAGNGAMVAGGFSVVRNLYHMIRGEENYARAAGNITADVTEGAVGGFVAGGWAGMTAVNMSNSVGWLVGSMSTIVGAVGYALVSTIYHHTGLREFISDSITEKVHKLFNPPDMTETIPAG